MKNKPSKTRKRSFVEKYIATNPHRESYRSKESSDFIPVKGHAYWFFDDGKCGPSRRYIARVTGVYTMKYVRRKMKDLFIAWQREATFCYWLYAPKSDYVVKCIIEKYDNDPCWFFRTKNGGWFSIDYPKFWMSGELDVSASKIKSLALEIERIEDHNLSDYRESSLSTIRDMEMERLGKILDYEHQCGNFKDISYGDLLHMYDKKSVSEFVGNELERS